MKSYKVFLWTTLLFSVIILIMNLRSNNHTIDISIHDTYLVIAKFHIWLGLTLFLATLTLVYFMLDKTNRTLNTFLTTAHYIMTIVPLVIIPICINQAQRTIDRYTPTTFYAELNNGLTLTKIVLLLILILLVGQLLLVINIAISKKTRTITNI